MDPANAYRDPRAHLAFRGGGSGGSLSEARDGPTRARLVKASTMPASSANNHASLDGEEFSACMLACRLAPLAHSPCACSQPSLESPSPVS